MYVPSSKESREASRGDHLIQRWSLEDGGDHCPDKGSPLPAFSTSLFSRNSSVQHGVPVDFMGQPQQTNGEEKHPSGALLSSQNLISAPPEGGWAALTLCGRGPRGLIQDPPSCLPCLPTTLAPFLLQQLLLWPPPAPGLSFPPPFAKLPQRPQTPV